MSVLLGDLCSDQVRGGALGDSSVASTFTRHHLLDVVDPPPSNFESPPFCHGLCSAEGMGVCQGLGGDLVSPSTAQTFLASCWGTVSGGQC